MTENLKPCPFCGGEAVYDRDWKDVQCRVCNARIANNFQRKKDAVEAWNKRANPWHTGTPTEEGWYLIKYKCIYEGKYKGNISYRTLRILVHDDGFVELSGGIGNDDVWQSVGYQRIDDVWKTKETD